MPGALDLRIAVSSDTIAPEERGGKLMDLETIYYIGQTIAVVAILVSLLAIYQQQRQTNEIEKVDAFRDLAQQTRDWWSIYAQDEETFETVRRGLHDFSSMSPYQQACFNSWAMSVLHIIEGVFFQYRAKLLDESLHEGYMIAMLAVLKTPGGAQWWVHASNLINPGVSGYLTERLEKEREHLPAFTDIIPHLQMPENAS